MSLTFNSEKVLHVFLEKKIVAHLENESIE